MYETYKSEKIKSNYRLRNPDNTVLISLPEVLKIIPLSKSRLYFLVKSGAFPRPVKISPGRSTWILGEVLDYRDARIAERDAQTNHSKLGE